METFSLVVGLTLMHQNSNLSQTILIYSKVTVLLTAIANESSFNGGEYEREEREINELDAFWLFEGGLASSFV